jgi:hypothetical protein
MEWIIQNLKPLGWVLFVLGALSALVASYNTLKEWKTKSKGGKILAGTEVALFWLIMGAGWFFSHEGLGPNSKLAVQGFP